MQFQSGAVFKWLVACGGVLPDHSFFQSFHMAAVATGIVTAAAEAVGCWQLQAYCTYVQPQLLSHPAQRGRGNVSNHG